MSYGDGPVPPGARPGGTNPGGLPGIPGSGAAGGGGFAPGGGALVPAPHGRRLVALLLDGLIIVLLAVAIFVGIFASLDSGEDGASIAVAVLLGALAYAAGALLYAPVAMALLDGRTVGKLIMGLRVVGDDGRPVGFGRAFLREVVVKGLVLAIASGATGGLAFLADALWPFVDDRRRALHDLISGTRVITG